MAYIQTSVDIEMRDETNLNTLENQFWIVWFYIYYFIEVEWDRFIPYYNPIYASFLIQHFLIAYQAYTACCVELYRVDLTQIQMCQEYDNEARMC